MIRLKKKAEEKKALEEIEAGSDPSLAVSEEKNSENSSSGFKLLGVEGKSVKSGEAKVISKKKTPGEIRIQKGRSFIYKILYDM